MTSIEFINSPYLLLVAIPLIGLSLIPYFKVAKKYRRTRNRIISLILHCLTIVLVTFALAGMQFVHTVSNTANEMILVVDVSDTQQETANDRDDFLKDVLRESVYQNFSVGVVTFGLNQVYAVPLTSDVNSVYESYQKAERPDTSATDIESALEYARTLFNHPESGKILLVTDGKETDGNVVSSSTVSAITAQGTKFDTVMIPSDYAKSEYQLLGVKTPDVQLKTGVEYELGANVLSSEAGFVRVNLYDNGQHVPVGKGEEKTDNYEVELVAGKNVVPITYQFETDGMHELKVELVPAKEGSAADGIESNNTYYTYLDLKVFKKVLVIERFQDDSVNLKEVLSDPTILGEDGVYEVSIFNLNEDVLTNYVGAAAQEGKIPESVDDLREYDQVILNNVQNADLVNREVPLDELLYSYVYEYGGGMLTVGGNDPMTDKAYAYNREDMRNTLYQEMLPVEAVDYTPPAGVFIIVDVSGSMSGSINGHPKWEWARTGAFAALNCLSERDMLGVMTLSSDYKELLPLTPRTNDQKIRDGIMKINGDMIGGDTFFMPSLIHAAGQLRGAKMEKNHIIIVSDGEIGASEAAACKEFAKENFNDEKLNLTISIVLIGSNGDENTKEIVTASREEGWIDKINNNEPGCGYYPLNSSGGEEGAIGSIANVIINDLNVKEITESQQKDFRPVAFNPLSPVVQGIERYEAEEEGTKTNFINVTLGGYYGVKKRDSESVDLVLTSEFQVPIYARWKFGKGSVGSFMCDLKGVWSNDLMTSAVGKQLVYNIVDNLMPVTDIRPLEINVTLNSKNYGNHLTCPTKLEEGEKVRGVIRTPDNREISLNEVGGEGVVVERALSESNQYSVCEFLITEGGIYTITIEKLDATGNVTASATVYKEFSYSKEYDVEYGKTQDEIKGVLLSIVRNGEGEVYDGAADVSLIFRDFETELRRVFDPRLIFMITAVLLFLLDVAVRKFKFKWLHEIIRDKKAKEQGEKNRKEERHE